jgi:hypothetical protein
VRALRARGIIESRFAAECRCSTDAWSRDLRAERWNLLKLTRAQYWRIVNTPRRRFSRLVVARSEFSLHDPVRSPCYWFERNDMGQEQPSGRYLRLPGRATISLVVDGRTAVFFYLCGKRLDTCTFAYDLTAARLKSAVTAMVRARLGRFIVPAAEWALREMPKDRRPVLEQPLRA